MRQVTGFLQCDPFEVFGAVTQICFEWMKYNEIPKFDNLSERKFRLNIEL